MHIQLASPQAAQLSILFARKSVVLQFCEGPDLGTTTDIQRYRDTEKGREAKKAQRQAVFKPMASQSLGMCSTAVLQTAAQVNGTHLL